MTKKRANEIFHTEYPEGFIYPSHEYGDCPQGRYAVCFDKNHSKVYFYMAQNYHELLKRFGFKLLYPHEKKALEKKQAELLEKIKLKGFYDDTGLFSKMYGSKDGFVPYSEEQIDEFIVQYNYINHMLHHYVVEA